jgi:hypothetical protein
LPVPWSASGRITDSDPDSGVGASGPRYDEYTLRLEAGRRYILRVNSSDFDPQAMLFRSGGEDALAQNDDGDDGLNSRISFSPTESGDYVLRVLPLGNDGRGAYRARPWVALASLGPVWRRALHSRKAGRSLIASSSFGSSSAIAGGVRSAVTVLGLGRLAVTTISSIISSAAGRFAVTTMTSTSA